MINVIHTGPFGVNTLVVSLDESRCFIVDPACCEFCGDEKIITRYLMEKNLSLEAIILTHGHFDHVAGLSFLKKCYPNIPILIHKDDSPYIGILSSEKQIETLAAMGFLDFLPSVSELPEATAYLENGQTLDFYVKSAGFENWKIIHTPGHTKGGICLYNKKDGELISGDTIFYGSFGRTDLPDGDESLLFESLNKIYSTIPENTKVYPGHDTYGFELKFGGRF